MGERPYTVLSCGMSLDGYLDAPTPERLVLSNEADLRRVDAVRAEADAILVGAATVRNDRPRLLVRTPELRAERVRLGRGASPVKVTLTAGGGLDRGNPFFTTGDSEKVVYCANRAASRVRRSLAGVATVVDAGRRVDVADVVDDLHARGIRRLMVEGGSRIHTQFLTQGLVDELHLVVAPFFVGDARAARFVGAGAFPWNPDHRAHLAEARQIGDVVLLRYALSSRFAEVS